MTSRSDQRETPVQLRRAIGAVRRARAIMRRKRRFGLRPAQWPADLWARAAMHLLQWGLS